MNAPTSCTSATWVPTLSLSSDSSVRLSAMNKIPKDIKGVTPVLRGLTPLSPVDGPYTDGIWPEQYGGKGWRTLRVEDEYADFDFALEGPDGTVYTGKSEKNGGLHVTVTPKEGEAKTLDYGPNDPLLMHHLGDNGLDLEFAAREHLAYLAPYRADRLFALSALLPGDVVNLFPLLSKLKDDGSLRVPEKLLHDAEDDVLRIEDVEREVDGTVLIHTDSGILTIFKDLVHDPRYSTLRVIKHEPLPDNLTMYRQPRRPVY